MKVVVVSVRGLQAGMLGCYGNLWVETPGLDVLASQAVLFDQHLADVPSPEGARRAWRSGCYHLPGAPARSGTDPDLLQRLRERHIPTLLLVDASRPAPLEFEEGWGGVLPIVPQGRETRLRAVLNAARSTLEELDGFATWLLWIDLGATLPPWDVPEVFVTPYFEATEPEEEEEEEEEEAGDESEQPEIAPMVELPTGLLEADETFLLSVQNSYAAAVSWVDAAVGELWEELDNHDLEEIVVLFTADHGQHLGEHGMMGTVRPWLHEQIVHCPLILFLPPGEAVGRRVSALTQSIDLAPTLADLFGVDLPGCHGCSLLPLARGEQEAIREYAVAGLEVDGGREWCLRTPKWSFLLPIQPHPHDAQRQPLLYARPEDRWEANNLAQHHPAQVEEFERVLRAFVAQTASPGPLLPPALPTEEDEEEGGEAGTSGP